MDVLNSDLADPYSSLWVEASYDGDDDYSMSDEHKSIVPLRAALSNLLLSVLSSDEAETFVWIVVARCMLHRR